MANMSYCRFNNTAIDFDDCLGVIEEMINDSCAKPLSDEELRQAKRLVCSAYNLVEQLADYAGVDIEDLNDLTLKGMMDKLQKDVAGRPADSEEDEG